MKRRRASTTWRCRRSTRCPPSDARKRQWVEVQRRRGRAFGNLGQWALQRAALEQALEHLQPDQQTERCEILSEVAQTCFWLFDIPSLERVSSEALEPRANARPRRRCGDRDGLARAVPLRPPATCSKASRWIRATIDRYGAAARVSLGIGSVALYWAGRGSAAVAMSVRAMEQVPHSRDATFTMYSLSHYALGLAAVGRYADSARIFAETKAFGRKYGTLPMLARAISMSAGSHLSLGDLDGAEAIQRGGAGARAKREFSAVGRQPGNRSAADRRPGVMILAASNRFCRKQSPRSNANPGLARLALGSSSVPGSRGTGGRARRMGPGDRRGHRRHRQVPARGAAEVRGAWAGHTSDGEAPTGPHP